MRLWALAHSTRTESREVVATRSRYESCEHDRALECNECYFDRLADSAW
jgi:hypothetical protein